MSWQKPLKHCFGSVVAATVLLADVVPAREPAPRSKENVPEAKDPKGEMPQLLAHSNYHTVAFSPDGKRVAAGGRNSSLKVWDAASGQDASLAGAQGDIIDVAFSPNGKWLAASDRSGAQVWETATGKQAFAIRGKGVTTRLAFTPDSARLAAGHTQNISIWNVATGQEVAFMPRAHANHTTCVAFSDGATLASCSTDKSVKLWDMTNFAQRFILTGHNSAVHTVAFSPDGKCLASASMDKTVKLWLTASGTHLLTLTGHTSGVHAVAFSPDGRLVASGSADRTVKVWDLRTGQALLTLQGHTGAVYSVAFSPDGRRLASTGSDCLVKLWDLAVPGQGPVVLAEEDLEILSCHLSGDDPLAVYRAILALSDAPRQTVGFLKERVRPDEGDPSETRRLGQLIAELDHQSFHVRERATEELAQRGRSAQPALLRTLADRPPLEVWRRIRDLLDQMNDLPPSQDQSHAERIVDVLERIGSREARDLLHKLAQGSPYGWLSLTANAALQRMAKAKPALSPVEPRE